MNEQAIQDAYNLFVSNGYKKSIDDFKKLIASNEQALSDSYSLFAKNGYKKSVEEFKGLMGLTQVQEQPVPVKKKEQEKLPTEDMVSPLAGGSLGSQKTEDFLFKPQYGEPAPEQPSTEQPVPQQPTEAIAVGPMGMTGLQRTAEYQPAKEFEGKGVGYILGDLLKTTGKGVVKFPADVLETASIVTAGVKNLIAKTGAVEESDASKFAIYKGAQEYKKLLDDIAPTDKDISSGFWGQTAKAVGEMVPIILSGFTAGGAKAIAAAAAKKGTKLQSVINYGKGLVSRMATPQGALTISQVAAPSYEQAKSEGATENEALTYAIQNALVSYPIEMLPVDGLFKRLDRTLIGNKGVEVLKRAFIGGSEEAITEGLQNIYENLSANQIYGTTKEVLDGVGNSSAVGGTVGALMNGLLTALLGRRARATTPDEKEQLDKSIEEVKTKVEQINSNNQTLTETINTLDESKPRTLTYGSADYNFMESNDGALELAQDDMTKEQAEGVIKNLSSTYKKIEFSIKEVEPEDPYKPTTYKVVGKPIKTEQNAIQKQAASEVPVQPRAGVSETLAEGKPQAEPQVTPEEGVQEVVAPQEEVAPELTEQEEDFERNKLSDKVFEAKKNIARAEDTEAAIEEYNAAKKELDDFEVSIQQKKDTKRAKSNVESLIEDENTAAQREGYEYKDLHEQDPRLAALQNSKDLLDFVKSEDIEQRSAQRGETIEEAKKSQERSLLTIQKDIADLEADLRAAPVVSLKTQEVAPAQEETITSLKKEKSKLTSKALKQFPQSPAQKKTVARIDEINAELKKLEAAPVVEEVAPVVEQYTPITPKQITHEKFTRDNAIDYEEGERETDSGREVTYLSRVVVEAVDDNTGDAIGGLVKIVDEDKNVSWQAQDIDGNELGKENFDSLEEAKTTLVNNWNKIQKKEFDKEAKKKVKAAEKAAAKKPKPATAPTAQVTPEEGPTAEDLSSIEAMLDLDIEDEDNMLSILNALDKVDNAISKRLRGSANEALLAIPLSTIQVVVKALKTLVKGGMLLRDAIKKVAADNNLSQDTIKDILNIAPIQDGFNALMDKVGAMIQRQTSRGTEEKRMVSNIDTLVRNSDVYQNANDAQKKILEREARTQAGVRERRAPSIGRVLGVLKDITNVSREDKLKIISEIRQLSKDAAKDLAKEIKELATQGKITVNQAANIVSRFGKVNMLSEISVSKFVDYMTKVFNDAEYASKLGIAKSLKKDIKKLSKIKDKNANLRDLGQKFSEIDPSMVENIDAYNDMASKIKEAIKGSTIRGQKVSLADMVNIDEASEYINKTLDAQDKMMREERAAEIQDLMGVDVSELSYDDMKLLLESKEPITKYNEGIIRSTINKAFNIYSSLIKETIATGKDPFTGEDVEFTKSQKDVVKRFMNMDLSLLSSKESLQAVDALANFLQNKSTAKMETVASESMAIENGKKMYDKGIKAFKLQKYWSPKLGRVLGEQVTALPVLFERLFKGFNAGGKVMDMIGLTNLLNKKSSAKTESNIIVENYVKEFYDKKANGEVFNSEYNNIERGMAAFMMRNVIGTEAEMNEEFNRRKNLLFKVEKDGIISGSIAALKKGNDKEKEKAELYQRAYDKIFSTELSTISPNRVLSNEPQNAKDIADRIDKTNLEAIDYWRGQWANKYEQLSEVSQNVYNTVLDKDLNYIPDRVVKLSSDTGVVELKNEDSAFHANNGILYKKESGSLMKATKPDALNKKRYIDLSFDSVNANAMYDALIDVNTAAPIRQVEAFLNSSYFEEIFPNSDDATIVKSRIQQYVNNTRGKNPYDNDELSKTVKNINRIAAIGVGQALGGVTQPIKQVVPVAINTLINAGTINLSSAFNIDTMNFLRESGYAIANRGRESQTQIESINKLLDQASKSKGAKALKFIEQANEKWIEYLLVKPDGYIARASWMTYYEQSLNKQGIDTKNIDYKTHELNEEAANYAQRMVDRQQNVSDADLSGQIFSAKDPYKQIMVKILMPLSGFRMNQSSRLGADLATLTNKTSTSEDKKIAAKSVAGFGAELVTFRLLGIYSAVLLSSLAKSIMDRDEDDEEKKKRIDNIMKGARTGTITDIVSPFPLADKLIQAGGSVLLDEVQKSTEVPISIFGPMQQSYVQGAGLFGIPVERALQLWELSKLTATGKYTDDYGKEKTISGKNQNELKKLIPFAIMTNLGVAPSEVNTVVRYAIKDAKKKPSKTRGKGSSINKEDMKKYFPDMYNDLYGPGNSSYDVELMKKEIRKEQEKIKKEMKDEMYK